MRRDRGRKTRVSMRGRGTEGRKGREEVATEYPSSIDRSIHDLKAPGDKRAAIRIAVASFPVTKRDTTVGHVSLLVFVEPVPETTGEVGAGGGRAIFHGTTVPRLGTLTSATSFSPVQPSLFLFPLFLPSVNDVIVLLALAPLSVYVCCTPWGINKEAGMHANRYVTRTVA
ncbi:hypothetical protein WH47_00835 [Habropoda laboriosa]|uniref:Uncharacterized protein n=1 Tax=Habropoda laboriosa TaxID=597456 RepID=A0A0L7R860_9HYME|nr:hypothetical protein WH47_00835 [Habropoda laboriosa]